jgi:hypothetical protein
MPATATRMVLSIWENYFGVGEGGSGAAAAAGATAQEVEEDPNDEEEDAGDEQEDALAGPKKGKAASKKGAKGGASAKKAQVRACAGEWGAVRCAPGSQPPALRRPAPHAPSPTHPRTPTPKHQSKKPEWVGASTGTDAEGRALYRAAKLGSWQLALGDVVQLPAPEESDDEEEEAPAPAKKDAEGDAEMAEAPAAPKKEKLPPVGLVQCLLQDKSGEKVVQVRAARATCWGRLVARPCSRRASLCPRLPPLIPPHLTVAAPLPSLYLSPRCACCCRAPRRCWATPAPTPSCLSLTTTPRCRWRACPVGARARARVCGWGTVWPVLSTCCRLQLAPPRRHAPPPPPDPPPHPRCTSPTPLNPRPPGVTLDAKRLERVWDSDLRGRYYEEDEALRKANKAAAAAGGCRLGASGGGGRSCLLAGGAARPRASR